MFSVRVIDPAHKQDIRLPNEPFRLWGRMVLTYENGTWRYAVEEFAPQQVSEMCFPDEDYDYDALAGDHVFVGAYDGERCVGLAVWRTTGSNICIWTISRSAGHTGGRAWGKRCWTRHWRSPVAGATTAFTRSGRITI